MSISAPFIARPIATSLLAVAVLLSSALAYSFLPISSLPQVDFPVIQVTTQLPGANADTMARLVTAPLERQLGQIPSLEGMSSTSSQGLSQITLQFKLDRDINAAGPGCSVRDQRRGRHASAKPALPAGLREGEPVRSAHSDHRAHLHRPFDGEAERSRRHAS